MQFDNQMSLFIPCVSLNVTHNRIRYVFENILIFGKVSRIDMKLHKSGNCWNVYVYFESWNETKSTIYFQERIHSKKKALVVYNDPKNWVVFKNKMDYKDNVEYNVRIKFNNNLKKRKPLSAISA